MVLVVLHLSKVIALTPALLRTQGTDMILGPFDRELVEFGLARPCSTGLTPNGRGIFHPKGDGVRLVFGEIGRIPIGKAIWW